MDSFRQQSRGSDRGVADGLQVDRTGNFRYGPLCNAAYHARRMAEKLRSYAGRLEIGES